ncbi:MAG: amidohydrolase family protein [bacterium]|nr:amidohydrolase family protein [bacterium]
MIIDTNAWLGTWPFRSLRDNTPETLVARLDRSGISKAAVSPIEAIFHRNVQPANETLAESIHPFKDRLIPLATLNPTYIHWEDDLKTCHETLNMKGVRIFPQYQDFPIDGLLAQNVAKACAERNLPLFIPYRIEDARERHWMDPGTVVNPSAVANLLAAVPNVTLVFTNMRGLARCPLWQQENLRDKSWYVDLSLAEVHRDAEVLVEQGGANHLLFGSHVPFSYPGSALVKRALLKVDQNTLENISYRNAEKILGLNS